MAHEHHQWLSDLNESIVTAYLRDEAMASERSQIQRLGHRNESHWVKTLRQWLPRTYGVDTRKYILFEDDDGNRASAETDIVVYHPAYPESLWDQESVLAGGVAAAFSVKRTVDRAALIEASEAAVALRRGMKIRDHNLRHAIAPPIFYGLLGESHDWKAPSSTPVDNVKSILKEFDHGNLKSPREGLDLVCIADLGCWARRTSVFPRNFFRNLKHEARPYFGDEPFVTSGMFHQRDDPGSTSPFTDLSPVTILIASLWVRLALNDRSLEPIADGLRFTGTTGRGEAGIQTWQLADVVSPEVFRYFESGTMRGSDWHLQFPPWGI